MDFNAIISAVSSVGFPIVACGVLFYQNNKLSVAIDQLNITLVENTTILKQLSSEILSVKKGDIKE